MAADLPPPTSHEVPGISRGPDPLRSRSYSSRWAQLVGVNQSMRDRPLAVLNFSALSAKLLTPS